MCFTGRRQHCVPSEKHSNGFIFKYTINRNMQTHYQIVKMRLVYTNTHSCDRTWFPKVNFKLCDISPVHVRMYYCILKNPLGLHIGLCSFMQIVHLLQRAVCFLKNTLSGVYIMVYGDRVVSIQGIQT